MFRKSSLMVIVQWPNKSELILEFQLQHEKYVFFYLQML